MGQIDEAEGHAPDSVRRAGQGGHRARIAACLKHLVQLENARQARLLGLNPIAVQQTGFTPQG